MRIKGDVLDGLLAQRGVRYNAFADVLNMSVAALTYIRNHEIKPVTAKKVADALGVDPKYIIVGGESLPDMVPVAAPVTELKSLKKDLLFDLAYIIFSVSR